MKYLIKDLAEITGLSPARIRKWQERFRILEPETGSNGYHYYTNEDLFVLTNISRELEKGSPLNAVIKRGRGALLEPPADGEFTREEWNLITAISSGAFQQLATYMRGMKTGSIKTWVKNHLHPLVVLVGRAWQRGVLKVSDEHAFSRWFQGFFMESVAHLQRDARPNWLVAVHPDDEHELGALMHYGILLEYGVAARFCGRLPENELTRELQAHPYRKVTISVINPRGMDELNRLKERIRNVEPGVSVVFGGGGYRRGRETARAS